MTRRAFTLLELIVVIVIMGIVGTVSLEIIRNSYIKYTNARELNKLAFKTDLVLNIIASKLQNRIKNSVIAVECNATVDSTNTESCLYEANKNRNFKSISAIDINESNKYPVLEWLYTSIYSKRGMWDEHTKSIKPGWSGFIDLKLTQQGSSDEYNITTPDSNFTFVRIIDGNWTETWGVSGYQDVFSNKLDTLVFSGSDGRGDIEDINTSYGYYYHQAKRVFAITDVRNDVNLTVKAITPSNSTTVYEGYYIVRGAMSIVPVYDKKFNDYNLTFRFNYFPWNSQMYLDGNSTLLVSHVTQFKFREDNGLLRIYICISSPYASLGDFNMTICKEKVVF